MVVVSGCVVGLCHYFAQNFVHICLVSTPLDRSVKGLDGAPEWPTIQQVLPAMADLRVVDLGCGYGWFCRWARDQGAAQITGLDLSQRMLERA